IQYRYDVSINAYVKDADGNYAQADVMGLFTKMAESSGYVTSSYLSMVNSMSSRFSSIQIWDEILPGSNGELISDLIYDQYDLVYGAWPSNENEVVLVLNERNEVSDLVLYSLGLITAQDMMDTITKAMQGETIEIVNHAWSYEEICGITFRLLADTDYYADTDGDGIYEDISSDSNRMTLLLDNARQITISGIIKPNPDSTSTALNGYICYTKGLTEAIIGEIDSSDIVKLQKSDAYANKNILSGLPFEIDEKTGLTDAEKAEQIREYFAGLSDKQKTETYIDILSKAPDSYVDGLVSAQMARYDTREKQEALIAQNYGMSSEEIHDFLTPYSDEELTQMIKGFIEEMIKTSYAQQQKAAVEEAITTPSEEETDALSAMTLMMLRSREAKEAYILSKWRESSGLSDEEISTYLSAKTDEEIDGITQFLAREDAVARYKSMVEPTSDIAYAKGAALFDAHIDACDEHTLAGYYDAYMPDQVSRKTRDEVLKSLGYTSLDSPSSINIYASTFENKDVIADVITNEYNKSVPEEDRISYTDYVKILMSSITTIINVISYVLIAFVAISLVVSSIMIGIITYISVLERTKEIGILRAIGASKKDISRVFNAETTVIGFGSGLIGILVTLILIVPINIIIRAVSGINNIGAILPWAGAAILVGISVILTLIAGLIPSKLASKKDPVIALRTE
ncbi:MAG: ABC transporter permease, partial [Clostridia bacterium]|nr:ABC transporter permease [Clostridia bacterium]